MVTHTIVKSYQSEAGTFVISRAPIEGELSQNVSVEIPAAAVDLEIVISIPTLTLKSCGLAVTKKTGQASALIAGPLTLETNSATVPADTIVISTTNGLAWATGDDPTANPKPITVTVTKIFVTNPGDGIAILTIKALNDPTP